MVNFISSSSPWQGRWNRFQSAGAIEHRKVLPANMVGWQEKFWIVESIERIKPQHFDFRDSLLMKFAWSAHMGICSEWL